LPIYVLGVLHSGPSQVLEENVARFTNHDNALFASRQHDVQEPSLLFEVTCRLVGKEATSKMQDDDPSILLNLRAVNGLEDDAFGRMASLRNARSRFDKTMLL
jgi:hypothetical protein